MNRYGYMFGRFCSVENAELAIDLGTKHKRDTKAVRRMLGFEKEVIKEHPELRLELDPSKVRSVALERVDTIKSGKWRPHPSRHIRRRTSSGKIREIDCPILRDHIVHWMLILVIKEALMRGMYKFSCGSIPGRGIEYARRIIEKWARESKSTYFVKLDIRKFYESIDHDKLKFAFARVIKDKQILYIIYLAIDSLPYGVAIGNYTSPWFSNFLLQPLDWLILQQNYKMRRGKRVNYVRHYLRQMDDMLLIGTSKRDLEKAVRSAIDFARDTLGLEIKNCWEIKNFADGDVLDMVGYRFSRETTILRKSIFLHTKRLAKHIYKVKKQKSIIVPHNAQAIESLLGWFSHANSKYFTKTYIKPYINENELKEIISNESKERSAAIRTS